jgi:hypothetical protein
MRTSTAERSRRPRLGAARVRNRATFTQFRRKTRLRLPLFSVFPELGWRRTASSTLRGLQTGPSCQLTQGHVLKAMAGLIGQGWQLC